MEQYQKKQVVLTNPKYEVYYEALCNGGLSDNAKALFEKQIINEMRESYGVSYDKILNISPIGGERVTVEYYY